MPATAENGTLVIDEIELAETPQSATWFLCFEATVGAVTQKYHVDAKGYNQCPVRIPLALELAKASAVQNCSFKVQLDDVDEDACTEEADNRSSGEFAINDKGEKSFKPQDDWRYTIRWHLK